MQALCKEAKTCYDLRKEELYILQPWNDISHFQVDWLQQIETHQSDLINAKWLSNDIKMWLEYLFNSESPKDSHFRCRLCRNYATVQNVYAPGLPLLGMEQGFLPTNKKRAYKHFKEHEVSEIHKKAIQKLKDSHMSSLITFVKKNNNKDTVSEKHLITSRMIRTVFYEIKLNVKFSSHYSIVSL